MVMVGVCHQFRDWVNRGRSYLVENGLTTQTANIRSGLRLDLGNDATLWLSGYFDPS